MRTRYELEKALVEQEISEYAARIIGDLTGASRHAERVETAKQALFDGDWYAGQLATIARYRRDLELLGVGGRGDLMGTSTERMPILRKLGKGRKQAADGAAWTAALKGITLPVIGTPKMSLIKGQIWLTVKEDAKDVHEPVRFRDIAPSRWLRADAKRALLWTVYEKSIISWREMGEAIPRPALPWGTDMEVIESALHECDMLEQEEKFFVLRDWAEKYYPELYEEWINTKGSEEEKEAWLEIIKVAPAQMRAWRPIWPGEMD